jgi:hypothetical protein
VAGQSITFDFLTTGVDRTSGGFRKVADNTVLAARGAKVLSDVIGKLGDKENRTAAESVLLAKALRQTGDAEDRVAARAVLADAAIRRLDDSMQDADKHAGGLGKTLSGLKLNPGLVGPLLALAPAIATLGGVGAGAAVGLGGAFIAGGAALAAFGAVAKPVLSDAKKAAGAVEKAQTAYNVAIASGVAPSKAFKAEQLAIAKAYAGMSPAQIALSKQLGSMSDAWDKVKAAQTPVIAGALQPWLKSVTGLTASLGPIIAKVAPVIGSLGSQFNSLVTSSAFKGFRDFIGSTGAAAVSAGGSTIIDLVKSFMILLPKFDPLIREAIGWISRLGPAVLTWSSSKKASDQIQAFLQWFSQNGHVVGDLLKNIGGALKALAPGLTSGGTAELQAMSGFFGLIAKLPPGLAKPLTEVAGALLIMKKLGVVSVGFKLLGPGAGAAAAAGGAGLWAKVLPGVRLAGGVLAAAVIVDMVLKNTSSGKGKNWFDNPFGMPGPKDNASANNWLTSWSPYLNKFKANFSGMTAFVSGSWSKTADFLHGSWSQTVNFLSGSWTRLGQAIGTVLHTISAAWNATWGALRTAFRNFVVNGVLGPLGTIIHGAALAFGWVPGLGGKLQTAASQFDTFRNNVNASLGGINNKTVSVSVAMTSKTNPFPGGISGRAASGMYVSQGTGPTADDVLIRASRGELIVPANMVKAGAVDHLRGAIPGFAGGGVVVSAHTPSAASVESTLMGSVNQLATAFAKSALAATAGTGAGGMGDSGARSGSAALAQAFARSIMGQYHWGPEQWPPWLYLGNQESGWSAYAVNKSSGAYGIGQSLGHGHPYNLGDYKNQVIWMANYIRGRYGNPANAWAHERANNWYAKGGLVPGYASGGVAGQGAAYLKAWQTRHGGPYALAVGPKVLNEQIPEMQAAIGRAKALAGAGGLSAGQHKFWANAAAGETRLLATLLKERTTERAWRTMLGVNELGLDKEIRAAGSLPSLAKNVTGWKAQMGREKATVAAISKMLGYSDAYIRAHPAAVPGPVLPKITHTYGGDVANNLGVVLAAALGPFTGAARGGLVFDRGGTLRPGFNPVWNNTGRPEPLVPARGGGGRLQIEWVGGNGGDDLERWIRKNVRIRGGGDVQRAYGSR